MFKWIAPAVLSLSVFGAIAAPAQAQDRRYSDRYDRYYRSDRDYRNYRYSDRASDLADRASDIRSRAEELYRDRRLSRSHRDRIIDRLDRVRDNLRDRNMSRSQIESDHRWLDSTERTLDQWSDGTYNRRWR